jgi:TusA-related sulfurtransferase
MSKIDARGLSCPAPVLETKAVIENGHPEHIQVLVDNEPAKQNVIRFLGSQGYRTDVVKDDGAGTLDDLKELEAGGLTILVCGTCLDHFDLLPRKQVGQTTNMLDIVTAMQLADKVINI